LYQDLDREEIKSETGKVLKDAEIFLEKYPFLKLKIASHTDPSHTLLHIHMVSKYRLMSVFFHLRNKGTPIYGYSYLWE